MSRSVRVLLLVGASIAVAGLAAACGTERIKVASSNPLYQGAVLFSQRCSGCHTLGYAGTHGSAANPRTAQANNGPNFDVRCERPVTRVLYAIENGGFSGAYMPQNVVVGQDAIEVAKFVATYAGTQVPHSTGIVPCNSKPIGTIPPLQANASASGGSSGAASGGGNSSKTGNVSTTAGSSPSTGAKKHKASKKRKTSKQH